MDVRGVFITVEGMDGSGKTSVCEAIGRHYAGLYANQVVLTREPGGNNVEVCELIRSLVLGGKKVRMAAKTEALLFAASRAEHIDKLIAPSINNGKMVICDRFVDSSIAYQGVGRGLGAEWVAALNRMVVGSLMPDLTVLLVISSDEGVVRARSRNDEHVNHLDLLPTDFHEKVNAHFIKMAQEEPGRFVIVEASAPLEQVIARTVEAIDRMITAKR